MPLLPDTRSGVLRAMAAGRLNSRAAVLLHSAMAEQIGLYATDTKALDLLMEQGPLSPSELARAVGLTTASTTALIDRLEARDLVERQPDPDDRRRVRVVVRPTALETVGHHLGPFLAELQALCESYSDDELAVVTRFMDAAAELAMAHARALRE
ncbi:MAG: MarR family transcriptional regulator [Alphaproteobacteria bacterium]|nr:MarR family transcriptional regulator [Alphaproteobacteria bacterium]